MSGGTLRVIDMPEQLPVRKRPACPDCGEALRPARRFEQRQTIPVMICWECGHEDPPYRASPAPIVSIAPRTRLCAWCSQRFPGQWDTEVRRTCSLACADKLATVSTQRRSDGRAMREPVR